MINRIILAMASGALVFSCQAQSLKWSFDGRPTSKDWKIISHETRSVEKEDGFIGSAIRVGKNGFYKTSVNRAAESQDITVSAVIFPTAYPPQKLGNNIISASHSQSPKKLLYTLRMQNNRLEFTLLNRASDGKLHYRGVYSSSQIPLNQWIHVCAVRDSTGLYLYINGVLDKKRSLSGSLEPADIFHIGSDANTGMKDRFFSGSIDEVSMQYSALTAREIALKFAAISAPPATPEEIDGELYYPLDLSTPSPEFPHAPVKVELSLQFLQACLGQNKVLNAENLCVVGWNRQETRPLAEPVDYRVSHDLYTRKASVGFKRASGVRDYAICFSEKKKPSGNRVIPLIGAGEPVSVGRTDIGADLGQALAGYPSVVDFDHDGDMDLLVSFVIPRRIFFHENIGTDENGDPILNAPQMIFGGKSLLNFDIHQERDGTILAYSATRKQKNVWEKGNAPVQQINRWICTNGVLEWAETLSVPGLPGGSELFDVVFQDADGDGVKDLLLGVQEGTWWWPDGIDPWNKGNGNPKIGYGKGYDSENKWLGNAPTGSVYLAKNTGSNTHPEFGTARIMRAEGKPIKMPTTQISPCLVDLNEDGTLDLLLAVGVDKMLAFYNQSADPANMRLKTPVNALLETSVSKWSYFDSRFEVCDWDNDGQDEVLVCSNPGIVVKCEIVDGKLVEEKILQCHGANVWAETLVVSTVLDFNHDGSWDIVMGDASGYLNFFPNIGKNQEPLFPSRERLESGGVEFHALAGYSGSIQGPEEARWGYLAPTVCDWDGDGKYDIVASDITGYVYWLPNQSKTATGYELGQAIPLEIDGKVRWRTKPSVFRDGDNLPYIVTSDPDGFLSMYKRDWIQGPSALAAGERLEFKNGGEIKIDGPSGYNGRNKLFATDWNSDGKTDILIGQTRRSGISHFDLPRSESATVVLMLNTGSNAHPVFAAPEPLLLADGSELSFGTHSCSPSVYDYDGDGHDDLFIGAETGFVHCYNRSLFEDGSQIIKIPSCLKKSIGRRK